MKIPGLTYNFMFNPKVCNAACR